MESFAQDLRYAMRRLLKAPGFTSVATLTLALGMGANAAIFSVADAVMLEPLPYSEPEERVMVWSRWKRFAKTWVNPAEMNAYKERCPSFAAVAYWQTGPVNLTGNGEAVQVGSGFVSASTFDVLGTRILLGRGFTAEEDRPNGPGVVILGYELWQGRYGGDPKILGRRIELDGRPHEVVGVMPRGFALPTDFGEDAAEPTALWVPRAPDEEDLTEFGSHSDFGAARLMPGASVTRANEELRSAVARLVGEGKIDREMNFGAFAASLPDDILGQYRLMVFLLAGAVACLMLIACANVANLLLAQADGRAREIALRSALGASNHRLLRQLLIEGLVLSVLAAATSLALAHVGLALLKAAGPLHIPRSAAAAIGGRTVAFALLLSLVVTVLFALAPAFHSMRVDLVNALRQGGARTFGGASHRRWRAGLIVGEVAFAVLLAVGAGLIARSLVNLGRIPLGFEPTGVLTAQITLPEALYRSPEDVSGFYTRLLEEVRALPGVKSAGLLRRLPIGQVIGDWGLAIEGAPPNEMAQGDWQVASDAALETLGIRLVSGRHLGAGDVARAPQVAVINETMAGRYWPDRDVLGRRFRMGSPDRPWISVVGVVSDVKHHGLTGTVKPMFFRPVGQFHLSSGNPPRNMNLVLKTEGDPQSLGVPVRAALQRVDPRIPLAGLSTLDDVVATSVAVPRFAGGVLALFAGLALALSAVGVFGVLSYVVTERTPEIGVRVALGAGTRQIRRLVLGEGLALIAAGVAVGLVLALALTRVMRSLLHDVAPWDPLTFTVVAGVLGLVGLLAAWLPARRASRVEPLVALRYE